MDTDFKINNIIKNFNGSLMKKINFEKDIFAGTDVDLKEGDIYLSMVGCRGEIEKYQILSF